LHQGVKRGETTRRKENERESARKKQFWGLDPLLTTPLLRRWDKTKWWGKKLSKGGRKEQPLFFKKLKRLEHAKGSGDSLNQGKIKTGGWVKQVWNGEEENKVPGASGNAVDVTRWEGEKRVKRGRGPTKSRWGNSRKNKTRGKGVKHAVSRKAGKGDGGTSGVRTGQTKEKPTTCN